VRFEELNHRIFFAATHRRERCLQPLDHLASVERIFFQCTDKEVVASKIRRSMCSFAAATRTHTGFELSKICSKYGRAGGTVAVTEVTNNPRIRATVGVRLGVRRVVFLDNACDSRQVLCVV
jgi:hypothetical protein